MPDRRAFLTIVSAGVATGLAGCAEDGPSTEQETDEEPESTEQETDEEPECDTTLSVLSGAMEPNIPKGSEVCIVEYESYEPVENPEKIGIIPVEAGEEIGYETLGGSGDVIAYHQDDNENARPIIARAISWEDRSYITKSDQNSDPYPDKVSVSSIIGVVSQVIYDSESEPESEPESKTDPENNRRCELGPITVAEEFFAAVRSGNTERANELSHPQARTYQTLESQEIFIETIEQVPEKEATTGEKSAPEDTINGVEEVLADGMAEEVQWVVITVAGVEGEFYHPMLKHEGCWHHYELPRD